LVLLYTIDRTIKDNAWNIVSTRRFLDVLAQLNRFLKRKVRLIACDETAMTLLAVKPSTKDVDFMVPNMAEYNYLIRMLKELGYEPGTASGWQRRRDIFRFDLFPGKRIHTTELLTSPLEPGQLVDGTLTPLCRDSQ
jgi:hypothetical protein